MAAKRAKIANARAIRSAAEVFTITDACHPFHRIKVGMSEPNLASASACLCMPVIIRHRACSLTASDQSAMA